MDRSARVVGLSPAQICRIINKGQPTEAISKVQTSQGRKPVVDDKSVTLQRSVHTLYRKKAGSYCQTKEGKKEVFYLTTHSTHFIYGYMAQTYGK